MVQGRNFDPNCSVIIHGVEISGPIVNRTVFLNVSSGVQWQVDDIIAVPDAAFVNGEWDYTLLPELLANITASLTADRRVFFGREEVFESRVALGSINFDEENVTLYRESVQPYDLMVVSSEMLSFLTPAKLDGVVEYVNLTIINPNGASVTVDETTPPRRNVLFYSDTCPEENWFGAGLDCRACPRGAECPGGYRMWPLRGFWTSSEEAGFVRACAPQRCFGGADLLCEAGYAGPFCSICADNYFLELKKCVPCGDCEVCTRMLLIATAVFVAVFTLSVFFMSVEMLNHFFSVICYLQSFRAIGKIGGSVALPDEVQKMYNVLGLITLDFQFNQPGCFDTSSDFYSLLWNNTMLLGACLLPIITVMPLMMLRAYFRAKGAEEAGSLLAASSFVVDQIRRGSSHALAAVQKLRPDLSKAHLGDDAHPPLPSRREEFRAIEEAPAASDSSAGNVHLSNLVGLGQAPLSLQARHKPLKIQVRSAADSVSSGESLEPSCAPLDQPKCAIADAAGVELSPPSLSGPMLARPSMANANSGGLSSPSLFRRAFDQLAPAGGSSASALAYSGMVTAPRTPLSTPKTP
jgi:hypothetical protein